MIFGVEKGEFQLLLFDAFFPFEKRIKGVKE